MVIVTGDLAHRGRREELEAARRLLDRIEAPVVVVPGNHDLPYRLPDRITRPSRTFEEVFGERERVHHGPAVSVCALDSSWAWRHQGGRLRPASLALLARLGEGAPGALRLVAFHHHVTDAPWRAARKLPLRHRDAAVAAFARAGVELVLGGHIHQASACERRDLAADGVAEPTLVLSTALGFGRPRPHRLGEAQGLQVISWDDAQLTLETRMWDGAGFASSATRTFVRGRLAR